MVDGAQDLPVQLDHSRACLSLIHICPGLLESVYEAALSYELEKRGLRITRQQGIPAVSYTHLDVYKRQIQRAGPEVLRNRHRWKHDNLSGGAAPAVPARIGTVRPSPFHRNNFQENKRNSLARSRGRSEEWA